jgi:hypothetical protein
MCLIRNVQKFWKCLTFHSFQWWKFVPSALHANKKVILSLNFCPPWSAFCYRSSIVCVINIDHEQCFFTFWLCCCRIDTLILSGYHYINYEWNCWSLLTQPLEALKFSSTSSLIATLPAVTCLNFQGLSVFGKLPALSKTLLSSLLVAIPGHIAVTVIKMIQAWKKTLLCVSLLCISNTLFPCMTLEITVFWRNFSQMLDTVTCLCHEFQYCVPSCLHLTCC